MDSDSESNSHQQDIPQTINVEVIFQQPLAYMPIPSKQNIINPPHITFKQTTQLIEDFPLKNHIDQQTKVLCLKTFIYQLTQSYNISFQNKQIHFYLEQGQLYMNCGIDPISSDIKIHPNDYLSGSKTNMIRIKIRKIKHISILHKLMSIQSPIQNNEQKQKQKEDIHDPIKSRRTKQRRIGYIIEKVIEWRTYYQGTTDQKNHINKLSLQQAAKQVNISKKSLDDYLFQIRFGFKDGFNFNQHYNDKVGVLRDFVRQKKKLSKPDNKQRKVYRNKEGKIKELEN